jgi:aerobic carbon-monoxide dehydrogenase medium subunit
MKAPAFGYVRPHRLPDVLALIERHGDEARLLAGGQTLLATLNMRLSEPALLIDLQDVSELRGLIVAGNCLRIGAMVTHSAIESSALVAQHAPLLRMAAPHIAHRAIRNLGTFGGSIAYGDPAAEWPACLLALEGVVVVRSLQGERRIAAQDFFTGLYTTALAANEVIVACELPVATPNQRFSFGELTRRHGDYAVMGLAAAAQAHDGLLKDLRLAWIGAGSVPQRSRATERALEGLRLDGQVDAGAGEGISKSGRASMNQVANDLVIAQALNTLRSELQPEADLTHGVAAKQHLAGVMLKRALQTLSASQQTAGSERAA